MSIIGSVLLSITAFALTAPQSPDQKKQAATPGATAPASPTAQNTAHQKDVVRIGVTLVQVDAIVTDKQGRQVTDLTADDFEIFEDGKRQLITNFSYFVTESAEAPPARPLKPAVKDAPPVAYVPLKPTQVRRSIAIVVDDEIMPFAAIDASRQSLHKFVDEQMQPGDLVAILRTNGSIGALQRFTADKQVLHEAIKHIRWNTRGQIEVFEPVTPVSAELDSITRKKDDNRDEDASVKSGPIKESRDALARLHDQRIDWHLLDTLNSVVRGMQELPGRKSVILFSPGFTMRNMSGLRSRKLQLVIERLNRAAISIYPIDSRGLVAPMVTAQEDMQASDFRRRDELVTGRSRSIFEEQGGLAHMAHETGGLTFFNLNNLSAGVRQALDDQNGYYLIGYVPEKASFMRAAGKLPEFRKIELKVKRAGLRMRSRSGYLGAANEELEPASLTSEAKLIQAVLSPFNAGDVRLRLTPLFGLDANQQAVARALLHIDVRDLSFSEEADGSHRTTLEVAAFAFGENGGVEDQVIRTYLLQVPKEAFGPALQQGFVCIVDMPVKKAGLIQIHAAVRDKTSGHLGSANEVIIVPDLKKKRLAISGIALSGKDWAGDNKPKAADSDASLHEQSSPVVATKANAAVRQFQAGSQMYYSFEVYNARLDDVSQRPRLTRQLRILRDGEVVLASPPSPLNLREQADGKLITVTGSLTLTKAVKPGQYVLQLLIEDELAARDRRTATQSMDFEVVN
jgi:VWFA-related protein